MGSVSVRFSKRRATGWRKRSERSPCDYRFSIFSMGYDKRWVQIRCLRKAMTWCGLLSKFARWSVAVCWRSPVWSAS